MPGEPAYIDRRTWREKDIEDVLCQLALRQLAGRATYDVEQVVPLAQQTFRDQEPRCEFAIMPGCSHDDRDTSPPNADLQRLLHGYQIRLARNILRAVDACNRLGPQNLGERHVVNKTIRAGAATFFANVFI